MQTATAFALTVGAAVNLTVQAGGGGTGTVVRVSRVKPAISCVTIREGNSVRLAVDFYGV